MDLHVRQALHNEENVRDRLKARSSTATLKDFSKTPIRPLPRSVNTGLCPAPIRELADCAESYSALLDKELVSAVKAGIVRKDIPVSILRPALLNYLNWTPRWFQLSGPLPLDELAGIYDRVFFRRDCCSGPAKLSASTAKIRGGPEQPAHSGTLGKFVRTAAELFSKHGYASTSTRSISKLIGMEKATLYYHVKSKEDLLYLIAKSSVETLQADVHKLLKESLSL